MPTKVTKPAAAKIGKLRRYVTYLGHTKTKGFFVKVTHGRKARPHRVLHVTKAAKAAMGRRLVRVSLHGKAFAARVVRASVGARTLHLAASQIGTKESPPGTNLQKYGAWYGANGESWCAMFVSWVLSHAGHPFKYAYVPYIVNDAKAHKNGLSVVSFSEVAALLKSGHVVLACYDWPGESPGVADHVGFVESVIGPTTFHAIEGNTSLTGSQSNGGEVCRQLRSTDLVQAFVKVV